MATTSMTWWDSLWSRVVAPWPVSTIIGERSMLASATPVSRLVAPGPRVPRATGGLAGEAAVDLGHEGRALLVAA